MTAFVRADAAKATGTLQVLDMLLNRASGNAKSGDEPGLRKMRIILQEPPQALNGFLTAFSDRFFLTAFRSPCVRP